MKLINNSKQALYPKSLEQDPTMKDLLLLSDTDMKYAQSQDSELAENLKQFRTQLIEKGYLSHKQLKFAGSILFQMFGDANAEKSDKKDQKK